MSWDVTDQQRVEDALRKSTARFDELVRRIPVGLFTFRLRADGSMGLDYVSPKFCELLDLDGESTSLDVRTVLARVHPEDHDDLMRAVEVGRQTRESTEWEGRVIVRAETEWIRIEADPSRSGSPSSDTLWNGVIINITQRKRTERALSELMEEQQLILDSVPAMIWYKDTSNRMLRVNQAVVKSLGVPKEQIEGKHTAAFYPEDADRYYRDDLTVIDTGEPRLGIEEPYQLPAGEKRWICTDKVPLKDASGRVTRLLVMSVDITERKLTEEALRRSEQQIREQHAELELIYQNAPIGLCLIDGEFRFLRINDQLAKINGSSVEAHRGCTVGQLLPDLADTLEPLCRLALETGEPVTDVEVQGVTPAQPGVERDFRVSLIPLRDKDGSILGIGCVVQEVTERKRAERALIEAQQRLLAIMEAVPIGISFSTDPSCTQVTGNPAVLAQFELHSGDNLSASARDHAAPGRHLRYFRDDREMGDVELPLQRAVAENRVIPPVELEVELPSGRRWFAEASAAPIHDAQGQVIGGVAVTVDITDRKRAELERQKFVSLVDHSAEFVGMCDMNFLPFYVNAAGMRLVGLESLEEACRTPVQDFFFADDQRFILEEFFPQVLRDGHGEVEIRFRHFQTGDPIWMIYNVFYLLGARGEPIGFGTVSRDITERKQTEEALRNADRNKDEFLATLAHELRNPLVPLRNALHLLRLSDGEGPATIARVREMMERQVNHMVRLVDDLLEVSRITRGKIELKKEPVALHTIIDHAAEISRPHIEASRLRLTVSVPPESLTLDADPIRLSQVFANLLNNAAKYTEAGGQIRLTAQRQGDEAVVSVRDTGLGIPADRLSRVFDLFAQFDPGGRHIQSGLGIGLALTRSLVQLHGGRVEARSDGAGQGSEFLVYLPLTAAQPAEKVTPETQQLALGSNLRILVVDDNTDVADSLGMVLRVLGAEVRVVYNGSAALEAIDVFNPTVVLLDVGMPEMDGYEVARQIRQQPRFHEVKLIALTGWGQEDDRRRSRAAGFDHHLVKPVDIDVLQTVLTELEESG